MKLKQGRFWFIRCKYPIPRKEEFEPWKLRPGVMAHIQSALQQSLLKPLRQPLYDTAELESTKSGGMTLFNTSGKPGQWGYFWMSEAKEIIWSYTLNKASRFNTREDAEEAAFALVGAAPWLIGHLEIFKSKIERES